jgi:hypothetical protein
MVNSEGFERRIFVPYFKVGPIYSIFIWSNCLLSIRIEYIKSEVTPALNHHVMKEYVGVEIKLHAF